MALGPLRHLLFYSFLERWTTMQITHSPLCYLSVHPCACLCVSPCVCPSWRLREPTGSTPHCTEILALIKVPLLESESAACGPDSTLLAGWHMSARVPASMPGSQCSLVSQDGAPHPQPLGHWNLHSRHSTVCQAWPGVGSSACMTAAAAVDTATVTNSSF